MTRPITVVHQIEAIAKIIRESDEAAFDVEKHSAHWAHYLALQLHNAGYREPIPAAPVRREVTQ